jgi:hypothetical protein
VNFGIRDGSSDRCLKARRHESTGEKTEVRSGAFKNDMLAGFQWTKRSYATTTSTALQFDDCW